MGRGGLTPWRWYWLCAAAWTAMLGAWMAAADVLGEPGFVLRAGLVMGLGFGAAFYLPFSNLPRLGMNAVAFLLAAATTLLDLSDVWGPMFAEVGSSLGATYRVLIAAFLWVMVWRSIAIQTTSDVVETLVPVGSVLLLALVSDPGVVAVVGAGVALLGTVALLALTHEQTWAEQPKRVRMLLGQRHTRGRSANSWPTVYVMALVAAIAASQGLRSFDITQIMGRELQIRLARILADWMTRQPVRYVSHEPRLTLYGAAPSSGQPLFEVQCDEADNWRMTAYERYQHGIWTRRLFKSWPARVVSQQLYRFPTIPGIGQGQGSDTVRMVVRARVPMAGVLPSRLWPRWVRPPNGLKARHFRIDVMGAVVLTRYVRPGDSYELVSVKPSGRGAWLSRAVRRAYLQLPKDFSPRIRQLAHKIAGRRRDPAAKAAAIAQYLRDNYTYDPYPPVPSWSWGDPTEYFLFVSRRGYCVQFASAMALMCRAVGLPARVVSGFSQGDLEQGRNVFLVRARDAHAWVEVFLPGEGWQSFDPTPPRPPTPGEVAVQMWDKFTGAVGKELAAGWRWVRQNRLAVVLFVLLVVGIVAAWRQWAWVKLTQVAPARASPEEQVAAAYRQMVQWLAAEGILVPPVMTPLEVAELVGREITGCADDARVVAAAFTKLQYSPHGVTRREARAAVVAGRKVLGRWLKWRREKRVQETSGKRPSPAVDDGSR